MNKRKIQEVTDYKVMTLADCMVALGWQYKYKDGMYEDIQCSCGGLVEANGFIVVEVLSCPVCNKKILDITAPMPHSKVTVDLIDLDMYEVEGEKFWIAIDGNGGIKL